MRFRNGLTASAIVASIATAGCFTRDETIVVRPNGSAGVTYEVTSDKEASPGKVGLPSALGWTSSRREETDREGRVQVKTTWSTELAHLNDYPVRFARRGDPHAAAQPAMRTRLEIRKQGRRTLYYFTRTYEGRRAGKYKELQEEDVPRDLVDREEASLTAVERDKLFVGLAKYESDTMLLRARDALGRAAEEGLIDAAAFESIPGELDRFLDARLTGDFLRRLFTLPEMTQREEEERLRREFSGELKRRLPPNARDRALFLLEAEERAFEVTEALNGESFSVQLELPGTVIRSNALMMEGKSVLWTFDGIDLTEGDLVLTAVSLVE